MKKRGVISVNFRKTYLSHTVTLTEDYVIRNCKNITITDESAICKCTNKNDDTDMIINMLLSDYQNHLNKAENIVTQYLLMNKSEINDDAIECFIQSFYNELDSIHDYFSMDFLNKYSIRYSANNDTEKVVETTIYSPEQFILTKQLIYQLAEQCIAQNKCNTEQCMLEIKTYLYPAIDRIFPKLDIPFTCVYIDRIIAEFEKALKDYYEMPLSSIEEALNNLKYIAYLLDVSIPKPQKINEEYLKNEFIYGHRIKSLNQKEIFTVDKIRGTALLYKDITPVFNGTDNDSNLLISLKTKLRNNDYSLPQNIFSHDYYFENINSQNKYSIYSFEQLIYLYLDILFHNRKKIGVCRYCKRLYVKNVRSNEKYCQRQVSGKSQTCNKIGPDAIYRNNAVMTTYQSMISDINGRDERWEGNDDRVKKQFIGLKNQFEKVLGIYNKNIINHNVAAYLLEKYYYSYESPGTETTAITRYVQSYPVAYIESFNGYILNDNEASKCKIYLFYALNSKGQFRKLYAGIICNENYDVKKYWNNVFKKCKIKDVRLLFISNNPEITETAKKKFPMADIQCNVSNLIYEKFNQLSQEKRRELYLDLKSLCTANSVEQGLKHIEMFSRYWGAEFSIPVTEAEESITNIYKYSHCIREQLAFPTFSRKIIDRFEFDKNYNFKEQLYRKFNKMCKKIMIEDYTDSVNKWNEISLELGIKK